MVQLLTRYYGKNRFQLCSRRAIHMACGNRLGRYFAGDIHAIDELAVEDNRYAVSTRACGRSCATFAAARQSRTARSPNAIKRPKAVRAVGLANGSNPVGLIVPCHRVIGSDGSLTGYGGGLHRKQWLLDHEGASFGDNRRSRRLSRIKILFFSSPTCAVAK